MYFGTGSSLVVIVAVILCGHSSCAGKSLFRRFVYDDKSVTINTKLLANCDCFDSWNCRCNHGHCGFVAHNTTTNRGEYRCKCDYGSTGEMCDQHDPAHSLENCDCSAQKGCRCDHGQCTHTTYDTTIRRYIHRCECDSGWTGGMCDRSHTSPQVSTTVSSSTTGSPTSAQWSHSCYGLNCIHGTCYEDSFRHHFCKCHSGWQGWQCDQEHKNAPYKQCQSFYSCLHGSCTVAPNGAQYCSCDYGWDGPQCDIEIAQHTNTPPANSTRMAAISNTTVTIPAHSTSPTSPTTAGTTSDPLAVICTTLKNAHCPNNIEPTCGSDDRTYINSCEFHKEVCKQHGLSVKHKGFC